MVELQQNTLLFQDIMLEHTITSECLKLSGYYHEDNEVNEIGFDKNKEDSPIYENLGFEHRYHWPSLKSNISCIISYY